MAKKAAKPKSAESASPEPAPHPTISKAEAVRQALAAGMDSPTDGTGFLKSTYGIEMTSQMWSSYKAQQKARDAKGSDGPKAKPGRKPKAAPVEGIFTPPKATQGSVIDDLSAIKSLVAKLGVDEVKKIADLFG